MDRLRTCMDALRVLARSNDPDRAVLVEKYIDASHDRDRQCMASPRAFHFLTEAYPALAK